MIRPIYAFIFIASLATTNTFIIIILIVSIIDFL